MKRAYADFGRCKIQFVPQNPALASKHCHTSEVPSTCSIRLVKKFLRSGIYTVTHDPGHAREHEVTCIKGRKFPPCRNCKGARFELKKATIHVEDHLYFNDDLDRMKMDALRKGRKK